MMLSKNRLLLPAVASALLALAWWSAAARGEAPVALVQDQDVAIQVVPVAPGLSMLVGKGGNLGAFASSDGLLLIDDQFEDMAPKIEAALAKLIAPGAPKQPRLLLNTHWHGDHTGGNAHFGASALVLAHENVRRRLAGDSSLGGRVEADPQPAALPKLTWEQGLKLYLGDQEIEVRHFEHSHTDGDSVVFFRGLKVAHLGDLFFRIGFPFVDLNSGGSVQGLERSIASLLEELTDEWKIIPGHGVLSTRADLVEYHELLVDCLARVEQAQAAGQTLEQAKQAKLFGDLAQRWNWSFVGDEQFLQTVWADLEKAH